MRLIELEILYGVQGIKLSLTDDTTAQILSLIDNFLPLEICQDLKILPLNIHNTEPPSLNIAMVDPDNLEALYQIYRILRSHELIFQRFVITVTDYDKAINKLLKQSYNHQKKANKKIDTDKPINDNEFNISEELAYLNENKPKITTKKHPTSLLKFIIKINLLKERFKYKNNIDSRLDKNKKWHHILSHLKHIFLFPGKIYKKINGKKKATIVRLIEKIFLKALAEGASDIHIEPFADKLRIRFRINGWLKIAYEPLQQSISKYFISQLKIMANLEPSKTTLPQKGTISREFQNEQFNFCVNTLPTRYGERISIQIFSASSRDNCSLETIVPDSKTLNSIRNLISYQFGLILVTGPVGSGKTTLFYSIINELKNENIHIIIIDSLHQSNYSLSEVTHLLTPDKTDIQSPNLCDLLYLHDPDIIGLRIEDIKTQEMINSFIKLPLNGYLTIAEMHARDTVSAIEELQELNVRRSNLSDVLIGVISIRLLRRVCTECRINYTPDSETLNRYGIKSNESQDHSYYKANYISSEERDIEFNLCPQCGGSGYKGSIATYEVLEVTEEIAKSILNNTKRSELRYIAIDGGMTSIFSHSLELVKKGYTTFEEVERVTFDEDLVEHDYQTWL